MDKTVATAAFAFLGVSVGVAAYKYVLNNDKSKISRAKVPIFSFFGFPLKKKKIR